MKTSNAWEPTKATLLRGYKKSEVNYMRRAKYMSKAKLHEQSEVDLIKGF
jgi:hypothetical protein